MSSRDNKHRQNLGNQVPYCGLPSLANGRGRAISPIVSSFEYSNPDRACSTRRRNLSIPLLAALAAWRLPLARACPVKCSRREPPPPVGFHRGRPRARYPFASSPSSEQSERAVSPSISKPMEVLRITDINHGTRRHMYPSPRTPIRGPEGYETRFFAQSPNGRISLDSGSPLLRLGLRNDGETLKNVSVSGGVLFLPLVYEAGFESCICWKSRSNSKPIMPQPRTGDSARTGRLELQRMTPAIKC